MAAFGLSFHNVYFDDFADWPKWRDCYEGGQTFVDQYLEQYSSREDEEVFKKRKRLTPSASFAASAVEDIRNAVMNRLHLVKRVNGSKQYDAAVRGEGSGVDLHGNSMQTFLAKKVLPELLIMGRVGVYLDMPAKQPQRLSEQDNVIPYAYTYPREDIIDWVYLRDDPSRLAYVSVLDRPVSGPLNGHVINRRMTVVADGVLVEFYEFDGENADAPLKARGATVEILASLKLKENPTRKVLLRGAKEIPFTLVDIERSLMKPVANHQIALMNLESSDIGYCLGANFPFFVEQISVYGAHLQPNTGNADGTAAGAVAKGGKQVNVGGNIGRGYSGDKQPAFIHPSSEPLKASMDKQQQLKNDIKNLLHQQIATLNPKKQQSAESAEYGERPMEAGLSFIGHTLQVLESNLGRFWKFYRTTDPIPQITYPSVWTLESDKSRYEKADALTKLRVTIPSKTFQREVSKTIAETLLTGRVTQDQIDAIMKEIDDAPGVTADPEVLGLLVEKGVLDLEAAAVLIGLDKDAPAKAAKDHEERLKRIADNTIKNDPTTGAAPGQTASESRASERDKSLTNGEKATTGQRGRGRRGRVKRSSEARTVE